MASPVGAILFLHPFPTSISHFPFSTFIYHSHFSLPFPTSQAVTRCCRIVFHAGSPAERQLFRTDFRFAPSLPQRFACGPPPIHEGHGRPRSVRKSSRLRWKCLSMDCICSDKANLSAHLHRLPTPPPYLRQMRLSPGRVRGCWMANAAAGCRWRSSCKSPRARILVLGTSGAHWPARWPRFELTERVAKS